MRNKGDRLYFKWKGYNNSFNSWSNMIDIVYCMYHMNNLVEIQKFGWII